MRTIFAITLVLAANSLIAAAASWSGTVVDVMCKGKDLANHSTKCAVSCAKGGYGLVLADGKFMKFDESGNTKALAALKATSKEKDVKAKVTGNLEGELIKVEAIQIE